MRRQGFYHCAGAAGQQKQSALFLSKISDQNRNHNFLCKSLLSSLPFSRETMLQLDSNPIPQNWQWNTLPLYYCCWHTSCYFQVENAQKPVTDWTR
jgi:hypothetical protein